MADNLDVLTWNFHRGTVDQLTPLERLEVRPGILTLQEVTVGRLPAIRRALEALGYSVLDSCVPAAREKRYGNLVATSSQVAATAVPVEGFPWPQLALRVRLDVGSGPFSVVTVHIPNGSANGWRKIDALEALRRLVESSRDEPLIVTGDFNEPQFQPLQDGQVVSWAKVRRAGRWATVERLTCHGETDAGERWDSAVRWFFDAKASGLRNAFWERHGIGAMEPSHLAHGSSRWFDHILATREFRVESCDFLHEWREQGFSDHSPLRAVLSYAADQHGHPEHVL